MKEALALLVKAVAAGGFQNIVIFPNGTAAAIHKFGTTRFESVAELAEWIAQQKPEAP